MSDIHPYSPYKIFCHHDNWKKVYDWYTNKYESKLVAPITISVDLANTCNMKCIGCNADFILNKKTRAMLDKEYLSKLAVALGKWGVKGACLGGGGESTLNPSLNDFIQALYENNIAKGIVTNGIAIKEHRHLKHMDWVGVSVDAGDKEVWSKVHGVKPELFQQVIDNMKYLVDQRVDVTYKYLVRPENVGSVYCAIRHAADIGCAAFHIRPMATPWFDDIQPIFTERDIELVNEQLHRARKAFGKHIDIVGVFNKLDSQWRVAHPFEKCWAIFATCVFQANKKVGLCCDLRGCQTVEVGPFDNPEDFINNFWGSDKHKKIQEQVDVNKCSRCTFSMLNQYFEQAIIQDRLMPDFI